jgi:hypothetical protein
MPGAACATMLNHHRAVHLAEESSGIYFGVEDPNGVPVYFVQQVR